MSDPLNYQNSKTKEVANFGKILSSLLNLNDWNIIGISVPRPDKYVYFLFFMNSVALEVCPSNACALPSNLVMINENSSEERTFTIESELNK